LKLLCKNNDVSYIKLTVGKSYQVDLFSVYNFYSMMDDVGNHWYLNISPLKQDPYHSYYVWNWFFTPQEERRMKLRKLES
jgi:hypothetical protein